MKTALKQIAHFAALAALLATGAKAQDWVKAQPVGKTVLVDTPHFRIVDVVIPPGAMEPAHTHPEYVELVLEPAKMRFGYTGKTPEIWDTEKGKAYHGEPDPAHWLENVDTKPFHILLFEMKDRPYVPSK